MAGRSSLWGLSLSPNTDSNFTASLGAVFLSAEAHAMAIAPRGGASTYAYATRLGSVTARSRIDKNSPKRGCFFALPLNRAQGPGPISPVHLCQIA